MNTISEMQTKLDALRQKPAVRILAMESSCDETAAAIIENGRKIVSSVIFSQADTHALYGGRQCRRSPAAPMWTPATGWWIRR